MPACAQLFLPNLRPPPSALFPTFPLFFPILTISLRKKQRQQERTEEPQMLPLADLRDPAPAWGNCYLVWPLAGMGQRGPGPSWTVRLPLSLSPPIWAWHCCSARVRALTSCLPGTEDFCWPLWACRAGAAAGSWEVSLFAPLPPHPRSAPWHRAERSLRLINLPPSLLLQRIFYSWTSGVLCFTRTRASIFHLCFACQHPAPSFLLPTSSRTRRAGLCWPGPGASSQMSTLSSSAPQPAHRAVIGRTRSLSA